MTGTHFSKILIISSLPSDEFQTGRSLYDWLVALRNSQGWQIVLEYREVENATELVALLQYEKGRAENSGEVPIIHIEAHGTVDENGIMLKNDTQIVWRELHPYLAKLNMATKLHLIVVLALCSGAHFIAHMVPSDRAPCWLMIGPKAEIDARHLRDRLQSFYREIFATNNGSEALKKLNQESDYGEPEAFFSRTATLFFKETYQRYLAELCTDKACRARADGIREELRGHMFPIPHSREIALLLMANKASFFQTHKKQFFMMDLFPENEDRFQITFEDVS